MNQRFSRPWARAILKIAGSDEAAHEVQADLNRFAQAMREVPAITQVASNPSIPMAARQKALGAIADSLEIGQLARNVVGQLLSKYRLVHLPAILDALGETLNRRIGIVSAKVTSAVPLDSQQRQRLVASLEKMLEQRIDLRLAVDPHLLGGFVALIGSQRYDVSLRGQLDRLSASLARSAADLPQA